MQTVTTTSASNQRRRDVSLDSVLLTGLVLVTAIAISAIAWITLKSGPNITTVAQPAVTAISAIAVAAISAITVAISKRRPRSNRT